MGSWDRARWVALTVLAAVAGCASVGIAALVRDGLCLHRLVGGAPAGPGMAAMPGMVTLPGAPPHGACPILLGAAALAGLLCLLAVAALTIVRPALPELAVSSARLVLAVRFAPLAAAIALTAALPLVATIVIEGTAPGSAPLLAAVAVLAAAALCAGTLQAAARIVVAFARRVIRAIGAALRILLAPGSGTPLAAARVAVPIARDLRLARRRPSRAPPYLR